MSGRVQSAQLDLRIAVQFEHIPVFNKTIDANLTFQRTGCLPMRRYGNSSAVFRSEMIIKSLNSTEVIGMRVREDDLAHNSSFGKQIVNARSQSLLLFLVGRSGIDYKKFARGVNQITVRMR